ncbi:hypothetical protein BD414DRAFT_538879 [Trametes punicea]|nr:hypothetical protein BD414DRAFT_538879 [Trametes punicea]
MAALRQYILPLLYATALTSLATHHLAQRKAFEEDRAHVAAQLSILEDLRAHLSAAVALRARTPRGRHAQGEALDEREVERLWRLARSHDVWRARVRARAAAAAAAGEQPGDGAERESAAAAGESIGWREVVFGRRFATRRTEELDRRDLERVRKEVEEAS